MGLYDRDYARHDPDGPARSTPGRRGGRGAGGVGSVRVFSVNTWIILINIAVFVLNNVVLQQQQWPVQQERKYFPGFPQEAYDHASPDRTRMHPNADGTIVFPLMVQATDPTGMVRRLDVGAERVRIMPVLAAFGHFSTGKFWTDGQVWRVITFQFLHADLSHIVFNMLGLWFVGGLVEQYLGRRRYAVFYLASGVCGALAYLALNLLGWATRGLGLPHFPFLLFDDPYMPLIGASAGVFGVMLAAAYIAPEAIVDVMLVLPMRLRTAVYIFLGLAVLNLYRGGENAGGDAAHVGGAVAGAFLIRRPHILRDMVSVFGLFRSPDGGRERGGVMSEREAVNRALEKASIHGTQSLTAAERALLRRAAGR